MKFRSDGQPGRLSAAKCTCGRQSVTKMMKPAFAGTKKRDFEVSQGNSHNDLMNFESAFSQHSMKVHRLLCSPC